MTLGIPDKKRPPEGALYTPIQAITGSYMKARPKGQHGTKLQSFYKRERHFASENFFFLPKLAKNLRLNRFPVIKGSNTRLKRREVKFE